MLIDCYKTKTDMCEVWVWVKVMYGGVQVVKRLGSSDSRDVSCFRASYMGTFSWADMDLGMSDANMYI